MSLLLFTVNSSYLFFCNATTFIGRLWRGSLLWIPDCVFIRYKYCIVYKILLIFIYFHINYWDMLLWEAVCLCLNRIHILTCATALLNNCVIIPPLLRHIPRDLPFFFYLAVYSPSPGIMKETIPHPRPSHGPQIGHFMYTIDITRLISV